jgi:hypothetical protein
MERFENKKFSQRIENLKKTIAKAISMGLITSASLISAFNANAQEINNENVFKAIKNNEEKMEEVSFKDLKVSNDKPTFVLAGQSELMDRYYKYDNNIHNSIYNKTDGLDDFSAGAVEILLLNSSESENFYIIQSNPGTIKAVLGQYVYEASSGAFDSRTISKPAFAKGAHYYIVFSVKDNEYRADIFDTNNGLVDSVKTIKMEGQSLLNNLTKLSEELGKKIESLK